MVKPKSYSLSIEIDRMLKLSLNNGQFEILAIFIDGYEDGQKAADNLMKGPAEDVRSIINNIRKK